MNAPHNRAGQCIEVDVTNDATEIRSVLPAQLLGQIPIIDGAWRIACRPRPATGGDQP